MHTPAVDPIDIALRPKLLADFAGQPNVTNMLKVAIDAANGRAEAVDHILLYGSAGLGKTVLANIVGNEIGVRTFVANGANITKGRDLAGILRGLESHQVLFIDEIHAMNRSVEEFFYTALEDFRIDMLTNTGSRTRVHPIFLSPFTVIGATTRPGKLTDAIRGRFKILLHMELYAKEDLVRIVQRSAGLLEAPIEESAAYDLANCARGIPRIANNLLRRVRDYAQVHTAGLITAESARAALDLYGIDKFGLDRLDRKIVEALVDRFDGKPAGLEALAITVDADKTTVEHQQEPHLIRLGFLDRTGRGRMATDLAFEYMKGRLESSDERLQMAAH